MIFLRTAWVWHATVPTNIKFSSRTWNCTKNNSILLVITLCQRKKSVADFYGLIDLNTKRNQKFYSKSN